MNSGATAPEWVAPAGGGWTVLQSTNVTSSVSNVVLTGLSSTYNTHMFTCTNFVPTSAGTSLVLRFGTSSATNGYSGTNDYGYHCSQTDDEAASYGGLAHATRGHIHMATGVNTGTDSGHVIGWVGGHYGGNELYAHGTGVVENTGAQTSGGQWFGKKHGDLGNTWDRIVILFETGNITAGRFTLYGLKNS